MTNYQQQTTKSLQQKLLGMSQNRPSFAMKNKDMEARILPDRVV
jgi:hypothetical protein